VLNRIRAAADLASRHAAYWIGMALVAVAVLFGIIGMAICSWAERRR